METISISVQKREKMGSRASRALRNEGYVPAILYGHGGESISIAIHMKTLRMHLQHNVRLFKLDFGDSFDQAVLKELQWDPFGDELEHIDLVRVRLDEVISMTVALSKTGTPVGVDDENGILEVQKAEIQIKCLPTEIPQEIVYNVTGLGLHDTLHVKDIEMPEGVTLDDDPDQVVATIVSRVEELEPVVEEEGEEGVEDKDKEGAADDEQADEDKEKEK